MDPLALGLRLVSGEENNKFPAVELIALSLTGYLDHGAATTSHVT